MEPQTPAIPPKPSFPWLPIAISSVASLLVGLLLGQQLPYAKQLPNPTPTATPPPSLDINIPTKLILIYTNRAGQLSYYLPQTNQSVNLKLSPVTSYLWSPQGKLAMLVQGKYGGDTSFWELPRPAKATTDGFNYLLYLVDLDKNTTTLIDSEIFGDVFWNQDSTGLYISEHYYNGHKLLLGNQMGDVADQVKYFFLDIATLHKSSIAKVAFDKEFSPDKKLFPKESLSVTSPDNKLIALQEGDPGKEILTIKDNLGKQLSSFPGSNPSWAPQVSATNLQSFVNQKSNYQFSIPSDFILDDFAVGTTQYQFKKTNLEFLVDVIPTNFKTIQTYLSDIDKFNQTSFEGKPSVSILSTKITTINGYPAVKREEHSNAGAFDILTTYFLKYNHIYLLQMRLYKPDPATKSAGESAFASILSSFKFTN